MTLAVMIFLAAMAIFVIIAAKILWNNYRQIKETSQIKEIKDRIETKNELTKTTLQVLSGILIFTGIITTLLQIEESRKQFYETIKSTRQTIEISQKSFTSERFDKAIQQLGSSEPAIRVGGILSLENVAGENPEVYRQTVKSILVSFIREKTIQNEYKAQKQKGGAWPSIDVSVALSSLGRFTLEEARNNHAGNAKVDLSGAYLYGADLSNLILPNVNLDNSILEEASLRNVDLSGSQLNNATMTHADLTAANLSYSSLKNANLTFARLFVTNFSDADMRYADLSGSYLLETNLYRAMLDNSDLTETKLLTQRQIEQATGNQKTDIPPTMARPSRWKQD